VAAMFVVEVFLGFATGWLYFLRVRKRPALVPVAAQLPGQFAGAGLPYAAPTNGMAIASLARSLVERFFPLIPAILGVIFEFVASSQIRRTGQSGTGLAIVGIGVGFVILGLMVVSFIALVALIHSN
jgi:hypothetical protein